MQIEIIKDHFIIKLSIKETEFNQKKALINELQEDQEYLFFKYWIEDDFNKYFEIYHMNQLGKIVDNFLKNKEITLIQFEPN